jgi:hypothetical protein
LAGKRGIRYKKKKDFQSKIYPAFGKTHPDGHWGFCSSATEVWGNDVLAFLETQMKASHEDLGGCMAQ